MVFRSLHGNRYPIEIIEQWKTKGYLIENLNFIKDGDYGVISEKTDFLGINYYSRAILKSKKTNNKEFPIKNFSGEKTKFGWEVFPDGLEKLLIDINNDYKPNKIYITENGCSYDYSVNKAKQINDVKRINYFKSHLLACRNAIKKGVPLEGYFHWSLMDNFEWAEGYYHRFGLIHVDYDTYERIPKASFDWYKNFLI